MSIEIDEFSKMKVHHIGIIVADIEKSIAIYLKLGYRLQKNIVVDNIQHNRVAFMEADFSPSIELIEPINEFSSVKNFKKGYHHICYELEMSIEIGQKFKDMQVGKIFTKPIIAPAIGNRKVIFACLRNETFVEFIL